MSSWRLRAAHRHTLVPATARSLALRLSALRRRRAPACRASCSQRAPLDGFDAALTSARFAVLWVGCGYLALPFLDELAVAVPGGGHLSLEARACLQLPLETMKAVFATRLLADSAPPEPSPPSRPLLFAAALAPAAFAFAVAAGGAAADVNTPLHTLLRPPLSLATSSVVLSACFAAPYVEERFFRGYLLTALRGRAPPAAAVLLQAALFSLAHLGETSGEAVQRLLLGAALGWVAVKAEGSLLAPMVGHAVFNAVALAGIAGLLS